MAKTKILALSIVMALLLALPAVVLAQAQPPRPPVFGGTVVGLDGNPAADGTMVTAMIGDAQVASTSVDQGGYAFAIPQPPGESYEGKMVSFMIGDLMTTESGTWEADGGSELNLTATTMMSGPATVASGWVGTSIFLMDSRGISLYLFTKDTQGTGGGDPTSACTSAGCLAAWPPLTTDGAPVAMEQPEFARAGRIKGDLLGSYERTDNGTTINQVTYNGWPIYYYRRDLKPGDVIGQYGDWFLVSPSGDLIVGGTNQSPDGGAMEGSAGAAGPAGARGPAGVAGPAGSAGAAGPAGAKGSAGAAGSAGAKGDAGAAGSAGAKGDAGSAGAAGSAGPAGPAGPAGAQGAGGGGALAVIALIIAILAAVGAGGAFVMGRRA